MIEFVEQFPISELSPADYNPRRIDDESFQQLRESLKRFGTIKPVLLNKNGTLIAGHQRIKAIVANKGKSVPMLRVEDNLALKDEARLNLYHNSVETNSSTVRIDGSLACGYVFIDHARINVVERKSPAIVASPATGPF